MSSYAQSYLSALSSIACPNTSRRIVEEISAEDTAVPHTVVAFELYGREAFLSTTVGLGARQAPLPTSKGLQYFEMCAVTDRVSPMILGVLSALGMYMLNVASSSARARDAARRALQSLTAMPPVWEHASARPEGLTAPLHDGALRYYREVGLR